MPQQSDYPALETAVLHSVTDSERTPCVNKVTLPGLEGTVLDIFTDI